MQCVVVSYLLPSLGLTQKSGLGGGFDRVLLYNFQTAVFVAASYFPTVTSMILLCKCCIFLVRDKVFLKSILKLKLM